MNIISNEKLIRRNGRIGQYTSLAGLLVLAGGLIVSFTSPEQFWLSWGALVFGFLLSQIGIYFGNRWGRRPRPDELLNQALKGLDRNYHLFHYETPASHLLVGPAGVWVLGPRMQRGTIRFEKGRWRQRGTGAFFVLRKFFAQEGLGRPGLELQGEIEGVQKALQKADLESDPPPIQAALVFTSPDAQVEAEDAPIPTLHARELKTFIRKQAKENRLSQEVANQVQAIFAG